MNRLETVRSAAQASAGCATIGANRGFMASSRVARRRLSPISRAGRAERGTSQREGRMARRKMRRFAGSQRMRISTGLVWVVFGCVCAGSRAEAAGPAYPPTDTRPVSDTYHGATVTDDYRWLEEGSAADVKAWIAAQNQLTRAYLDAIPQRPAIARRVAELMRARAVRRNDFALRGGRLFAMKNAPPNNQPQLVVLPANGDVAKERVVVDPLVIDPSGKTTIDFYRASYDGKHVVVSLSANGSEDGTAY